MTRDPVERILSAARAGVEAGNQRVLVLAADLVAAGRRRKVPPTAVLIVARRLANRAKKVAVDPREVLVLLGEAIPADDDEE